MLDAEIAATLLNRWTGQALNDECHAYLGLLREGRLLARRVGGGVRLELLELQFDGDQIRVDRVIQQVHLLAAQLFAAPAELLALQDRDLVSQLVDTGLPVMQFPLPSDEVSDILATSETGLSEIL